MEPNFKLHQKVELLDELIPDTTETYKGEVVGFFVSNFKDEEGNSQYMYQILVDNTFHYAYDKQLEVLE